MATFVLVHGAFQGGWVWREVAAILCRNKHEVHSPTFTGSGDRSHLLSQDVSLHTDIKDITNFLHFEDLSNVILVSHGYAGMVASALIQTLPHVVKKVFYLDAVIPEQGKCFLDLAGDGFGYVVKSHLHNRWLVKPWESVSFGISRPADKKWFESRLVNFPLAAFTTPFPEPFAGALLDASYIHCKEASDELTGNAVQHAKGRGWDVHELESGRLPMVTAPEDLAELLMKMGG